MMVPLSRRARVHLRRRYRRRINRAPSPLLAAALPWASVMLLSLLSASTVVLSAPLLPPIAFQALLAWRLLRPGMLPVWAGFPLGAVDDLYSGQPLGSAILLWSLALLLMEQVDRHLRWRGFLADWLVSSALIVLYLAGTMVIASFQGAPFEPKLLLPQAIITIIVHPLVARLVAALDRIRLLPLKKMA